MFKIKNLEKSYKKNNVLNIKSFDFSNTGLYVIVGPNGSGKTTLLKALTNLVNYTGEIYFNDVNIKELGNDLFKDVCYIEQFNSLFNNMSCIDNLEYNDEFLNKEIHCSDDIKRNKKKIKNMSGGQKKKASLERFYSLDFKCLLLDEPTTSLDKESKEKFFSYVNKYKNEKLIICVTHDQDLIELADNKININNVENNGKDIIEKGYIKLKDKHNIHKKHFLNYLFENKKMFIVKTFVLSLFLIVLYVTLNMLKYNYSKINTNFAQTYCEYCNVECPSLDLKNYYNVEDIVNSDQPRYDYFYVEGYYYELFANDTSYYATNTIGNLNLEKYLGYSVIFSNSVTDVEISDYMANLIYGSEDVVGDEISIFRKGEEDNNSADVTIGSIYDTNYEDYLNYYIDYSNYSEEFANGDAPLIDSTNYAFQSNRDFIILPASYFNAATDIDYGYSNLGYIMKNFSYLTFDFNLLEGDSLDYTFIVTGDPYSEYIGLFVGALIVLLIFEIYIEVILNDIFKGKMKSNVKLKIYSASNKYIYLMSLIQDLIIYFISFIICIIVSVISIKKLASYFTESLYYDLTGNYVFDFAFYPIIAVLLVYLLLISIKYFKMKRVD